MAKSRYLNMVLVRPLLLFLFLFLVSCVQKPGKVDLLLLNGIVYDGAGGEPRMMDVGIKGDRIVFMGHDADVGIQANDTLNVKGLMITQALWTCTAM